MVVVQVVEEPLCNQKAAGSSPALPDPIDVSLSKILNPKLLLVVGWYPAWQPLPPVCEWVNVRHTI